MTYKITPRSGIVQDQRRIDHVSEDYLSPKTETLSLRVSRYVNLNNSHMHVL